MREFRTSVTLTELLVVVALGVGTTGLALPAVQSLRAKDARIQCSDHLRLIGTAALKFAGAHNGQLPRDKVVGPRASWNVELLAHIGQEKLAKQYAIDQEWWKGGEDGNRKVASSRIDAFVCPAAPGSGRWVLTQNPDAPKTSFLAAPTDYVGSAGAYCRTNDPRNLYPGAMHHRNINRRIRLEDIEDGSSNTLLVVEMADKPNRWRAGKLGENRLDQPQMPALSGQWAAPNWNHLRSYSADGREQFGPCAVNCSNQASIYGFHEGGANVLFVDGSVRFLKSGMSQGMLIALVSIANGELIGPNDY